MAKRILIVEDDQPIARLLCDNFVFDGFAVECESDGRRALDHARRFDPDLVLLDLMLPGVDGMDICRALANSPRRTSIIILTAKTEKAQKIEGLELGADDYVTKPFALDELLARVHAVMRRSILAPNQLALGDISIDFRRTRASRGNVELSLTDREFAVLRRLAERVGQVVSRDELLRVVWGYREAPRTRTVDNLIARLRRKIEADPHHPCYIRTAHRDGYRLTVSRS